MHVLSHNLDLFLKAHFFQLRGFKDKHIVRAKYLIRNEGKKAFLTKCLYSLKGKPSRVNK